MTTRPGTGYLCSEGSPGKSLRTMSDRSPSLGTDLQMAVGQDMNQLRSMTCHGANYMALYFEVMKNFL